jgi:hypothetical protein
MVWPVGWRRASTAMRLVISATCPGIFYALIDGFHSEFPLPLSFFRKVFGFSFLSDPIRGGLMRIGRNEIVEELTAHMRKFGGEPGAWCVGVAETDSKFQIPDSRFQIQDSRETPSNLPELAYREAHTAYAAADAVEYLVSAFGLRPAANQLEHHPAQQGPKAEYPSAPLQKGRIVYIHRQAPAATAAAGGEHPTFRKLAA